MNKTPHEESVKSDGTTILSCRNLWKVYGAHPDEYFKTPVTDNDALVQRMHEQQHITACVDVSFDVHVGEIFVIMGLSGSGKSTVVRCLSRLVESSHGQVLLEGKDLLSVDTKSLIDIRRHKFGMVFQNFGLLPHLNVIDNVAFPLKLQGMEPEKRRISAQRVIDLVGLEGREQHFPRQLSGGQQQRVGIARSLVVEPELWFLDEPFSSLDPLIRRQMQDEFLRIQQMLKKSIVFITHDFLEALRIADRIAIMRDGKIVQIGTPIEVIINPANDYVAEFSQDVPRVKVLTAKDVIDTEAVSCDDSSLVTVRYDMTVEQLLPVLKNNPRGIGVERDGNIIGVANAQSVIKQLARDTQEKELPNG